MPDHHFSNNQVSTGRLTIKQADNFLLYLVSLNDMQPVIDLDAYASQHNINKEYLTDFIENHIRGKLLRPGNPHLDLFPSLFEFVSNGGFEGLHRKKEANEEFAKTTIDANISQIKYGKYAFIISIISLVLSAIAIVCQVVF